MTRLVNKNPQTLSDRTARSAAYGRRRAVLAMNSTEVYGRVLSIQSHVVHGYVGNKCAVFPLQRMGFDVDPINSVQFSNHTGYPTVKGSVFDGEHLLNLLSGLEANNLSHYTHLLTGYIGSESLLNAVVEVVSRLRKLNPELTYVCDPVMGDEGKLYIPAQLVGSFRASIAPLACIITPNQYEAELLADRGRITTLQEAALAARQIHKMGPHTVVITSLDLAGDPDHLTLLASTVLPQQLPGDPPSGAAGAGARPVSCSIEGAPYTMYTILIPKIGAYFTGTGDLFAALLLAWQAKYPGQLATALELAVAGMQEVLHDTAHAAQDYKTAHEKDAKVFAARELRVVQNQQALVHPTITLRCTPLHLNIA